MAAEPAAPPDRSAHSTPARAGLPLAPDPLPMPVVDNHCHLESTRAGDPVYPVAEAIAAARAVGVERIVQVGCELDSARATVELIDRHPELVGAVALHPNEAARIAESGPGHLAAAFEQIESLAAHPRVRAIGETGLDYLRTAGSGRVAQHESFRWHIDLAVRTGKALQIHDRDAHSDVLRVLDDGELPKAVVLHCFSGDQRFARECLERGFLLSFAGTVTFKNARDLREALAVTPLDRVLVETDAPYLAPTPHRGATNASYLVPLTVRAMAATLMVDVPTLCRAITENTERVYGTW